MIIVKAVQCNGCQDIIYSRTENDDRKCTCKATTISGGILNKKVKSTCGYKDIDIELNTGLRELYEDWAIWHDKFGLIKGKKVEAAIEQEIIKPVVKEEPKEPKPMTPVQNRKKGK